MGREIYNIINDMAEVLNASQMQRLQEVLVKRLSENATSEHSQTTNVEFGDMFLTAKHLEGCSDKTIRYYRCNIEKNAGYNKYSGDKDYNGNAAKISCGVSSNK